VFTPTGFTTTGEAPGPIEAYVLTDSYWVKDGKRSYLGPLPSISEKNVSKRATKFDKDWDTQNYLSVMPTADGMFDLGRDGKLY
jgi:hypothetical protein